MKTIIHRGSSEIGGTCIQLSTDRTTILLDLGLPLSQKSKQFDLASIKTDAVLISHPHQDHYGLIDMIGNDANFGGQVLQYKKSNFSRPDPLTCYTHGAWGEVQGVF